MGVVRGQSPVSRQQLSRHHHQLAANGSLQTRFCPARYTRGSMAISQPEYQGVAYQGP